MVKNCKYSTPYYWVQPSNITKSIFWKIYRKNNQMPNTKTTEIIAKMQELSSQIKKKRWLCWSDCRTLHKWRRRNWWSKFGDVNDSDHLSVSKSALIVSAPFLPPTTKLRKTLFFQACINTSENLQLGWNTAHKHRLQQAIILQTKHQDLVIWELSASFGVW